MIWSDKSIVLTTPRALREETQAQAMAEAIAHHLLGQMAELAGRREPDALLTFRFAVALEQA